jgi:ferric-dicitrate binding protein FerR (iron transport regulator)
MGANTWEGVEYIDRDRFREVLAWVVRLDTIDAPDAAAAALDARIAARLADAAEAAGYRVDRLREALSAADGRPGTRSAAKPKRAPARSRRPTPGLPQQDPPKE